MPWIHLHVGNEGYVKACCLANINFGNINEQPLGDIWKGKPINQLREKFMKGEPDSRCGACYKLEDTGGKSVRQETFEKFPNIKIKETPSPLYFDIRFSNVCNFRCRTCWHGASSRWFEEAKLFNSNIGEKAIIKNVKDYEKFIENCGPALLGAKEIYFAGGEPLATEEHYLLLDWLVENNATLMRLRYNTNFSMLNLKSHKVLDYWTKFKSVEILASIDASEELGEYIRKDMNWRTLLRNRDKIRAYPHLELKIAPTVSVFNVFHLPDLYKQCLEIGFITEEGIYINILDKPNHYNIQILPADIKQKVVDKYASFFDWMEKECIPDIVRKQFQECLDYMLAEDRSKFWSKFINETKKLDNLRGENIMDVLSGVFK